ncbi:Uncharacterised protein [Serratia rubidaea]|uniref:Uncharacterized protein n=1 Tax=Serratia rubidaea TaxID=61652 RepID=A0A3S4JVG5_SERRU|nr:Uncharacterised protein [Serratia rubidaea]
MRRVLFPSSRAITTTRSDSHALPARMPNNLPLRQVFLYLPFPCAIGDPPENPLIVGRFSARYYPCKEYGKGLRRQMDTVEELGGSYFFDGMIGLSASELAFWIVVDEARKQLGVSDILSLALIIGGLPLVPVPGKLDAKRTTKGTSYLSLASRKLITYQLNSSWKTLTWKKMLKGKWTPTKSLGAFVGRWLPWIGVFITAYDLTMIGTRSLKRYNLLVRPEDRL